MFYTENIKELINDKLTIIFNKSLLNIKVKLILCIPDSYDINSVNKYREIYDELTICRFSPENPSFWNFRNLYKYIHYCSSFDISENEQNIFIEQKNIIKNINIEHNDINVKNICNSPEITDCYLSICNKLKKHNYQYEKKDNFICYNFDCCYFNNKAKRYILIKLNELLECIQKENIYIRNIEKNILLSMLLENTDLSIHDMQIDNCLLEDKLSESMYLLI
jgi:hypothetical protein